MTSVAAGSTAYTGRCRMPVVTGTVDAEKTDGPFVRLARLADEATAEQLDADVRPVGGAGIRITWPEDDVQLRPRPGRRHGRRPGEGAKHRPLTGGSTGRHGLRSPATPCHPYCE
ncbi:hypothetical protein ACIQ6K_37435 [Streptomyces sp. NPDC096354]|uniref:hypothetical protein n=1 Tax=Streptomyces sp. NPDC096354 TaxID=3366088 RepID=UPI0037F10B6E